MVADEKEKKTRYWRPVMCHQISCSDCGFPQFIAGEREADHGRYEYTRNKPPIEISAAYKIRRLVKNLRPSVI